jgi:hypothetical protein
MAEITVPPSALKDWSFEDGAHDMETCVRRAKTLAEMADSHLREYAGCELDRRDVLFVMHLIQEQLESALQAGRGCN